MLELFAVVIPLAALYYNINENAKRHELYIKYCNEILMWHEKVINIIMFIKIMHYKKIDDSPLFFEKLAELSAIIEVGRFYFPNINQDKYGTHKPAAYRGFKEEPLELLVAFYNEAQKRQPNSDKNMLDIQRRFTSVIFEKIEPAEYIFKRQSFFSYHLYEKLRGCIRSMFTRLK